MNYLHLFRYKNLLLLALMQFLFRFGFLKFQNCWLALTDFQFVLLVLSTVLVAAGGYIINAIFDVDSDFENQKKVIIGSKISEKLAYNLYFGTTVTGVAIGFYLSNIIQKPSFAVLFILMATLLYFYSTSLQQLPLIGNLVVAFLVSFSILIIGIFDLYPATYDGNQPQMRILFSILLDYAVMAFIISIIREIVKDLEDYEGDLSQGLRTLPIVLGSNRTAIVVAVATLLPVFLGIKYLNDNLMENSLYWASIYILLTIIAPLLYVFVRLLSAKIKSDFSHISNLLKLILLFGILSIAVLNQNILHHG